MPKALILSYAGCSTCKKALQWLEAHRVEVVVRPIVDEPPTARELAAWIRESGLDVRKWLNTSGQSYRALDKAKVTAATDQDLVSWLSRDGKLVKRPVLVVGKQVLVGFREEAYDAVFAAKAR